MKREETKKFVQRMPETLLKEVDKLIDGVRWKSRNQFINIVVADWIARNTPCIPQLTEKRKKEISRMCTSLQQKICYGQAVLKGLNRLIFRNEKIEDYERVKYLRVVRDLVLHILQEQQIEAAEHYLELYEKERGI